MRKRATDPNRTKLLAALRPALARLRSVYWAERLVLGAAVGLACALSVSAVTWFVPTENRAVAVILVGLGAALLFLLSGFLRNPNFESAIKSVDRAGLAEKIVTAHEFSERSEPVYALQRLDALAALADFDPHRSFPMRFSNRIAAAIALMIALNAALLLLPYRFEPDLQAWRAFNAHAKKEAERVGLHRESIEKTATSEEQLQKLLAEELKSLERALASSKTPERALKAIADTELGLSRVEASKTGLLRQNPHGAGEAENLRSMLGAMAEALAKNSATQSAAQKLEEADFEGAKNALEELASEVGEMSDDEFEQMREALMEASEAAASALGSGASADSTAKSIAGALAAAASSGAPGEFGEQIGAAGQASDMLGLGEMAMRAVAEARSGVLTQTQGATTDVASSAADGEGTEAGGKGTSRSAGISKTSSKDGSGSGVGTGSTDKDAGKGAEAGDSVSQRPGGAAESTPSVYERIYAPSFRIGGDAETSQIQGASGKGPSEILDLGPVAGEDSEHRVYTEILGHFEERAFEALSKTDLPLSLQDYVKEYFSSLKP